MEIIGSMSHRAWTTLLGFCNGLCVKVSTELLAWAINTVLKFQERPNRNECGLWQSCHRKPSNGPDGSCAIVGSEHAVNAENLRLTFR